MRFDIANFPFGDFVQQHLLLLFYIQLSERSLHKCRRENRSRSLRFTIINLSRLFLFVLTFITPVHLLSWLHLNSLHLCVTVEMQTIGVWGLGFGVWGLGFGRSEEHTSELQSQ